MGVSRLVIICLIHIMALRPKPHFEQAPSNTLPTSDMNQTESCGQHPEEGQSISESSSLPPRLAATLTEPEESSLITPSSSELTNSAAPQIQIRPVTWRPVDIQVGKSVKEPQTVPNKTSAPGGFSIFVALLITSCANTVSQSSFMIIILLITHINAQQLIGYDTAGRFSNKHVAMKTISLLGVDPCDRIRSQSYANPVEKPVQLLYRPTETQITVIQCKIMLTVKIFHCATNIFRSDVYPADVIMDQQILPVTDEQCRSMKTTGKFDFDLYDQQIIIRDIKHTQQSFSRVLVGTKDENGACTGADDNFSLSLLTLRTARCA